MDDLFNLLDLLHLRNEQANEEPRLWQCDGPPRVILHGGWAEVVIDHDPDCLNPRTCVARSN